MAASEPVPLDVARPNAVRSFGRLRLLELLGKSSRTMLWRVDDPRRGQELLLAMPRRRPAGDGVLDRWHDTVRKATRVDHPALARTVEVGEHERWPYVTYELGGGVTLAQKIGGNGLPAQELVPWAENALQGLAFAHEAGVAHHDLQPCMLVTGEPGRCHLIGLGVGLPPLAAAADEDGLARQRQAAERDLLAFGLVLHHALAGAPAFDQPDVALALERLPPWGREIVRLPWSTAQAISEPLRAIVNRATDRQPRQRYRNARTLLRALEGWRVSQGEQGGGALALLLDRLQSVGVLPATPGAAARAAHLAMMERERTNELAAIVLQDTALTFELLRAVNSAQRRGALAGGNGPVLTIRRAIAMLGLDGVRRAALALRDWPGPLNATQAAELERLLEHVKRAGRIAQWLRPPGYDSEVVYLLALLQNLGRLVLQYHFPDEAEQIRRLMQPLAATRPGEPDEPGMSEQGASYAVLGADVDALGAAVAHHWGLDPSVLRMIHRVPVSAPVHAADSDDETLRLAASCGNEVADATAAPAHQQAAALQRAAQRYGRVLGIVLRDVQRAAQGMAPDTDESARVVPALHEILT